MLDVCIPVINPPGVRTVVPTVVLFSRVLPICCHGSGTSLICHLCEISFMTSSRRISGRTLGI